MFGMFFLGALYMQRILGYYPLEVGLAFLPGTIVMGTMSLLRLGPADHALRRRRRADRRCLVAIGAALLLFARTPVDGSYVVDLLPIMLLFGFGAGPRLPGADAAGDVGRDAERHGARLGPRRTRRRRSAARSGWRCWRRSPPTAPRRCSPNGDSAAAALNSGYHLAYLVGAALVLVAIAVAVTRAASRARTR